MLGSGGKSSDTQKSCVDYMQDVGPAGRMDELDPIRELVVEAMVELERALIDGLPAQAPKSCKQEVEIGLAALKDRIERAGRRIEVAERLLSDDR